MQLKRWVSSLKILKHYKLKTVSTPCCVPHYIDFNLDVIFWTIRPTLKNRDSSVGTATGYGLDGFRFPVETRDFSLLHSVETGSGAHQPSFPMDTGDYFPGVTAAGA
jgi:hypothetical protein